MAIFNLPLSLTVATQNYGNTVATQEYSNTVSVVAISNTVAINTLTDTVELQEYSFTTETNVDIISMADEIFTGEDAAVPYGVQTTIITVSPTSQFRLVSYKVTGTASADIEIIRNGTTIMKDRTSTSTRSAEHYWTIAPPIVETTETLVIKVTHYETSNQSFFVTVSGYY